MSEAKKTYLSKIQLKAELDRCLNCKNQPCMHACPVNCNPQEFINHAKQGAYGEAVKTITRTNPMGQTCGLICPDKFCMQACTRSRIDFAVNIPKVQATILENFRNDGEDYSQTKPKGKNVAVIGAGPAGIAAASLLAKSGYEVNIFEAGNQIGGALNMIPDARLPHDVIEKDWKFISNTPLIRLHLNARVGDVRPLLMQYDGVIIATGEPNTAHLNIEGEELCLSHMEYLHHPERYATSGRVAVIGGGNVAADCAFTAAQNGAEQVEMFVRRRLSDMKISKTEYLELLYHQINISPLCSPEKIEKRDDGLLLQTHRNRYDNGKTDPLPDSSVRLPGFALIIKAVGSYADDKIEDERIIYAGDCKTGGSTIVEAIASGRTAAAMLAEKLG